MVSASKHARAVAFWVGLYVVLALAPLAVAAVGFDGQVRSFWAEFGLGLGFVGLSMMALQFVLTARFKGIAAPFGTDAMLQFHRQAGLVACAFVFGHVGILVALRPQNLSFFDPSVNLPRAFALVTVLLALVGLVGLTLLRKRLRFPYEWWRLTHGLLALLVLLISLAHVLMVGRYVSGGKQAVWIALTAGAMALLLYPRLVKPWLARKRPYKVTGVTQAAPRVWTLTIEADGHAGLRFKPGQFAWLTLGGSPFGLQQHPFTFAGSANAPGRYEFMIKELGDFTSRIGQTEPGTRAWLEGPYGAFTPDVDASSIVMIAGGIGITPMLSILRTMKERGDRRPAVLVFGAGEASGLVAREELERLDVRLVLVVEKPGQGWEGESGLISAELLERVLPADTPGTEYFICGPEPMMDTAERALMARGVPMRRRHSERFNIA
jgi:predicted ferric reductase